MLKPRDRKFYIILRIISYYQTRKPTVLLSDEITNELQNKNIENKQLMVGANQNVGDVIAYQSEASIWMT